MRKTEQEPGGKWFVRDNDGKPISWEAVQHELYGALCKLKDYEDTGLSPHDVEEIREMHRWIPVTEMTPETEDFVLAFVVEGHHGHLHLDHTYCIASYDPRDGWLLEEHPEVEDFRISHWMPLSEPEVKA